MTLELYIDEDIHLSNIIYYPDTTMEDISRLKKLFDETEARISEIDRSYNELEKLRLKEEELQTTEDINYQKNVLSNLQNCLDLRVELTGNALELNSMIKNYPTLYGKYQQSLDITEKRGKRILHLAPHVIFEEMSCSDVANIRLGISWGDKKAITCFPEIVWARNNRVPTVGLEEEKFSGTGVLLRNKIMANNFYKYIKEHPEAEKLYLITGADHTKDLLEKLDTRARLYEIPIKYNVFKIDGTEQNGKLGAA